MSITFHNSGDKIKLGRNFRVFFLASLVLPALACLHPCAAGPSLLNFQKTLEKWLEHPENPDAAREAASLHPFFLAVTCGFFDRKEPDFFIEAVAKSLSLTADKDDDDSLRLRVELITLLRKHLRKLRGTNATVLSVWDYDRDELDDGSISLVADDGDHHHGVGATCGDDFVYTGFTLCAHDESLTRFPLLSYRLLLESGEPGMFKRFAFLYKRCRSHCPPQRVAALKKALVKALERKLLMKPCADDCENMLDLCLLLNEPVTAVKVLDIYSDAVGTVYAAKRVCWRFYSRGWRDEALSILKKAEKDLVPETYYWVMGFEQLVHLADAELACERTDKARKYVRQALSIIKKQEGVDWEQANLIGSLAISANRTGQSFDWKELFSKLPDHMNRESQLARYGSYLVRNGQAEKSLELVPEFESKTWDDGPGEEVTHYTLEDPLARFGLDYRLATSRKKLDHFLSLVRHKFQRDYIKMACAVRLKGPGSLNERLEYVRQTGMKEYAEKIAVQMENAAKNNHTAQDDLALALNKLEEFFREQAEWNDGGPPNEYAIQQFEELMDEIGGLYGKIFSSDKDSGLRLVNKLRSLDDGTHAFPSPDLWIVGALHKAGADALAAECLDNIVVNLRRAPGAGAMLERLSRLIRAISNADIPWPSEKYRKKLADIFESHRS